MRITVLVLFMIALLLGMGCGKSNVAKTTDGEQTAGTIVDTIEMRENYQLLIMEISDTQTLRLYTDMINKNMNALEITQDSLRVSETDSGVILNLSNNKKLSMINFISGDTNSDVYSNTKYTCDGYIPSMNAWLIQCGGEFSGTCESGYSILVNADTGEEIILNGDPVLSPGGWYFYTFQNDALSGFDLSLYKFNDGKVLTLEYKNTNPFEDLVTDECSSIEGWIDDQSLLLRVDCGDDIQSSKYLKIMIRYVA